MAEGAPSTGEAADGSGQPVTRLAGGPVTSHVLHSQSQDCCPGNLPCTAQCSVHDAAAAAVHTVTSGQDLLSLQSVAWR